MIPNCIARLNVDGSTDETFDPGTGLNAAGLCAAVLPSGLVVVGGEFVTVNGSGRQRLAVLNDDGTVNDAVVDANDAVRTLIVQTDGKVLVGGSFNTLAGVVRNRVARLKADLALEPAYDPNANGALHALAQQENGETIIAGSFTQVGATARNRIARLYNDAANNGLTVESAARVVWLRGGASQETMRVTFEVDTGGGYGALGGTVARIAGGWEVTGLALAGTGTIRARAHPTDSHSEGALEDTVNFDVSAEIGVGQGADELENGVSEIDYGDLQVGSTLDIVLTISNTGLANLTLTGATPVTLSGTNANQWSIVAQPSSPIAPGESVEFVLRFAPTSTGSKVAAVAIASDDADEDPFDIDLSGEGTPGPGSRDTDFQPVLNDGVITIAAATSFMQLGGVFTVVNGVNRGRFARLDHDGVALAQVGAGANDSVLACVQLSDGKWLIGGAFTTINGVGRSRLARLNSDGSLDSSFNVALNGGLLAMAVQPDGGVIIGGEFTTAGGQARQRLARITAAGLLDPAFNPGANGPVWSMAVQADAKLVVSGNFTTVAGVARAGLARLNASGSLDGTFDPAGSHSYAYTVALQSDGKVLVAGRYVPAVGATVDGLKRLTSTGALDGTFTETTMDVRSIAVQADGKILAGGYLNGLFGAAANRVVRVTTTGAVDTGFVVTASGAVYGLALAPDGGVLVAGNFNISSVNYKLVKLINHAASSALTVPNNTQVQWLRGGTLAETQHVTFDLSQNGGTSWTALGNGARIAGGWQLTGISLPISGLVRARARIASGYINGSAAIQEATAVFSGMPVPDVQVEYPLATVIADDGTLQFTGTLPGQTTDVTITIRNTGNANLTGIVLSSSNLTEFAIVSQSHTTLVAGQAGTAVLRFAPVAVNARSAVLTIASNVPGAKNPYVIGLRGTGIAAPVVVATDAATTVTSTTATLNGRVKANHDTAKAYFEYKRVVDAVWIKVPAGEITVATFNTAPIAYNLTGLTASTAYHYRAAVYNSVNTSAAPVYGATVAFNTTA